MSLADWTPIFGNKGGETDAWHTAGKKCYVSPNGVSMICHNKTLNDKPKDGHIDFDFALNAKSNKVGIVFKGDSSSALVVIISTK